MKWWQADAAERELRTQDSTLMVSRFITTYIKLYTQVYIIQQCPVYQNNVSFSFAVHDATILLINHSPTVKGKPFILVAR